MIQDEEIQVVDTPTTDDIQSTDDALVVEKVSAGEKIKRFFRSLFVSENGNEAKFLTFYKKEGTKSVLSSLICIVAGIFIGWLVLLIIALSSKDVPDSHAFRALGIILAGPFASGQGNTATMVGQMLFESTPGSFGGAACSASTAPTTGDGLEGSAGIPPVISVRSRSNSPVTSSIAKSKAARGWLQSARIAITSAVAQVPLSSLPGYGNTPQ